MPGLARELLERGADPNAFFVNEYGRMSALYGAAGRLHDPELTRLLLEAGADPDDGESLYHATEAEDPACLELLLEHGASTGGTNALAHALDDERLPHVRALLAAGADPNEGAMLAHAVRRGRGPEFLRLLAEHGAELDRPGGETWRGDVPLRTPYQHAVLRGAGRQRRDARRARGVDRGGAGGPRGGGRGRGERPPAPLPEVLDPDAQEVLILAALRGRLDAVVDAVGVDFSGVVGGSPEGTLLHHAAWVGNPELVARAARARARTRWRARPRRRSPGRCTAPSSRSYRGATTSAVAELLTAAGADRSSSATRSTRTARCTAGSKGGSGPGAEAPAGAGRPPTPLRRQRSC